MKQKIINMQMLTDGAGQAVLQLTAACRPYQLAAELTELSEALNKGKALRLDLSIWRQKRSLSANAYLWVLCQRIAEKMGNGLSKEEVYRRQVQEVGCFDVVEIRKEAWPNLQQHWQRQGLGYQVELAGEDQEKGTVTALCYFGSSVYDSKEMSLLLEAVIQECQNLGIETRPEEEIQAMLGEWEKREKKTQ